MKTETTIAKDIRIAADKARYDAACKRLLSDRFMKERFFMTFGSMQWFREPVNGFD